MTSLIANEPMLAILSQAKELAEIRDPEGKVIGFFAPIALPKAANYANAAAHIDPVELRRRRQSSEKGITTKEVFKHLKTLTKDDETRHYLQQKIDVLTERDECHSQ